MDCFEIGILPDKRNLTALTRLNGEWIDRVQAQRRSPTLILDIDSSECPIHGDQEGTAYNGHFGCTCYHALLKGSLYTR